MGHWEPSGRGWNGSLTAPMPVLFERHFRRLSCLDYFILTSMDPSRSTSARRSRSWKPRPDRLVTPYGPSNAITGLKPHIPYEDALASVTELDRIVEEVAGRFPLPTTRHENRPVVAIMHTPVLSSSLSTRPKAPPPDSPSPTYPAHIQMSI